MITKREEQAYRLCHHEFEGLTTKEVAERMGLTSRRIEQLLQSMKKKAPQLFPIFTKQEAQIEELLNGMGYDYKQVAKELDIAISTVKTVVQRLKEKGVYFEWGKHGLPMLQYEDWMDNQIKEKF